MKFRNYVLVGLITVLLSIVTIVSQPSTAHAIGKYSYSFISVQYSIPKSWRGTYTHNHQVMRFNTHSISRNGKTLYKSTWHGYHKLAFAKTIDLGHYLINAYAKVGYESSQGWKLSHKNGKKVLTNYQNEGNRVVWYQK